MFFGYTETTCTRIELVDRALSPDWAAFLIARALEVFACGHPDVVAAVAHRD
jgi:hypothetical protein